MVGADKVEDFFFMNEDQEKQQFGSSADHQRAGELAKQIFDQRKPAEKVSFPPE